MKTILKLLIIFFVQSTYAQKVVISGRINNITQLHQRDFCMVAIQKGIRIDSAFTDKYGFYTLSLEPGQYDFIFKQKGFENLLLKQLYIYNTSKNLNFGLRFIYASAHAASTPDSTTVKHSGPGSTVAADGFSVKSKASFGWSESVSESKVSRSKSGTRSGSGSGAGSGISGRGSRAVKSSHVDADGVAYEDRPPHIDDIKSKDIGIKPIPEIKAGQITAGHWKDLDNWNDWLKTNEDINISSYMKTWGFFPKNLQHIKLQLSDGQAARHVQATLTDGTGKDLWTCISDAQGNCYFWSGIYGSKQPMETYQLKLISGQQQQSIRISNAQFNSSTPLTIQFNQSDNKLIEIGFMVDATGSMSDEIRYLQVELIDVISRIKKERPCSEIKTGSVFYRDYTDDYLTRVMPLSANPSNTISFIGDQSANGGGDFPEAVEAALKASIDELGWSNSGSCKILFMILDAPPHQNNEEHKKIVRDYAQKAAEMGIRLIPVTASGIDKSTEFLMKYLAITTNGEYIYITNDSKIGNSHLKPTGGESKVEYLNDLMVRTVLEYSAVECNKMIQEPVKDTFRTNVLTPEQIDSIRQNEPNSDIIVADDWYMRFYPNPANEFLLVQFSETVESLRITSLNGVEMFNNGTFGQSEINMNISSWASGMYVIYAIRGGKIISGKLLVMH